METHDCSNCSAAGDCPLESIAPWLNDHAEEAEGAVLGHARELSKLCAGAIMELPLSQMVRCAKDLAPSIQAAFVLGYCKGRTFPIVPEVFERA